MRWFTTTDNRKFTAKPSYYDLQKDAKEEIDKLDNHIKECFKEYIEILILLLTGFPIIFLIISSDIPLTTFTIFSLTIPSPPH